MADNHENRSQIPGQFTSNTSIIIKNLIADWCQTPEDKRESALDRAAMRIWDSARPHLKFFHDVNPPEDFIDTLKATLNDCGVLWEATMGAAALEFNKRSDGYVYPNPVKDHLASKEAAARFITLTRNAAVSVLMNLTEREEFRAWTSIMWSFECWCPRKEDYINPESAPDYMARKNAKKWRSLCDWVSGAIRAPVSGRKLAVSCA